LGFIAFRDPKRTGARGFDEGIFDHGFGGFSTVKRNTKPEMTARGYNGDAFTGRGVVTQVIVHLIEDWRSFSFSLSLSLLEWCVEV